ncbi:nuclear transport factor 2 family protein [Sphingomonas sp. BT-65]|uniref:nuclear transport factor 2 family protein n=1 Tax=Sphingomonas sp. BT-65 TaxID=2989821 RepID=UPI00223696A1|nr:nuclear transport factor 2 family protein [Sphingomonas sp. BT-65]MCW4460157.1 nuclear transport factor 2 family protein [Sphingomonas sp. BT-65]
MEMLTILSLVLAAPAARTPSPNDAVLAADAAFWRAFNQCDAAAMGRLLAADIEFYHDKTGLTAGRDKVVESLVKGPCGTPGLHVRREEVAGSVAVDPVPGLGAIVSGVHRFYAKQGDAAERLDGDARFAVVWRKSDTGWAMARVLSYAHRPAG